MTPMQDVILFIVSFFIGAATFALLARRMKSDCIP